MSALEVRENRDSIVYSSRFCRSISCIQVLSNAFGTELNQIIPLTVLSTSCMHRRFETGGFEITLFTSGAPNSNMISVWWRVIRLTLSLVKCHREFSNGGKRNAYYFRRDKIAVWDQSPGSAKFME